ncbi:hypothetical protein N0V82_009006 [Gnomoniopsis sp. IMI 355080]|nr:hypothetical protein N0V82_009006 [Gnomoniopsis sp. IMI 355080]
MSPVGHHSTHTLKHVVVELVADRVLFSVDYPYETFENCCNWCDGQKKRVKNPVGGIKNYKNIQEVGRANAKSLLRPGKYTQDYEAPVLYDKLEEVTS